MGAGSLHYASRRKAGAGGHIGAAACRCGSGADALGKLPKESLFPICVHPMERPSHACPLPAGACIVLPRAAPQSMRPREPREPDTAEDAGGQTDHLGQAYKRWLGEG